MTIFWKFFNVVYNVRLLYDIFITTVKNFNFYNIIYLSNLCFFFLRESIVSLRVLVSATDDRNILEACCINPRYHTNRCSCYVRQAAVSERLSRSIIFRASPMPKLSLKRVKCARIESVKYTVKITSDQAFILLPSCLVKADIWWRDVRCKLTLNIG